MRLRPSGTAIPTFERLERRRMSLANLGAEQGPGAPIAAFLGRLAGGLMEGDAQDRARAVADQAAQAGTAEGAAAAAEMRAPALKGGDTVADRAYDQANLAAYVARLDVTVAEQADRFAREHGTDVAGFTAKWDGMAKGLLDQMPGNLRPMLSVELDKRKVQHLHPIWQAERRKTEDAANADLLSGMNRAHLDASNAWRKGDAAAAQEASQRFLGYLGNRTDLDERGKVQAREAYRLDMRRNAVLGEFDRELSRGGPASAERFIAHFAAPGMQPDLDPDHVKKIAGEMGVRLRDVVDRSERAQAAADKANDLARSHWYSDFTIRLNRGELGYGDIERAYEKGLLKPHERSDAVIKLDKRREKDTEAAAAIARVTTAFAGAGTVLDPKSDDDRKAVNAHFGALASGWQNLDVGTVTEKTVDYARRVGIVPDPVKSQVRGWLRAGSEDQKVAASQLVQQLRNANPQLLKDFADEDLRQADLVNTFSGYGVPPADAVRKAEEAMRRPKGEADALRQQYEAVTKSDLPETWLKKQLQPSWFGNAALPPVLSEEFSALAREEYTLHGNMDAARATALSRLQRVWGVSNLTNQAGAAQFARFAPEKFYAVGDAPPAEQSKWMKEQLLADLQGQDGLWDPGTPLDGRLWLIPNPDGAADRETGLPLYGVMVRATDGTTHLMRKSDGRALLWKPDWATSPAGKRAAAEQQEGVSRARAVRAGRGAPAALPMMP
ncbi:hypothetical protein [Magnetospirillum sp. UT-4]|uniref:hypothetical protein n=1 Tax=Magnetospirillum sp. UT-4 TaxID=2681467 RepID=UPI00137FCB27|nr:hypothetical protein [Magnetospirillum sp. UT-4]CAA7621193.1 hypothetical protein MTBUT4_380038 [Magnetospirillum sp. UT-4]